MEELEAEVARNENHHRRLTRTQRDLTLRKEMRVVIWWTRLVDPRGHAEQGLTLSHVRTYARTCAS